MPTVAIVGRPNVGKSALFNRLAGRRIAIVHDQPGVTRDRISAPCYITTIPCTLIDTGGIGATLDDGFGAAVATEADIAMQTADLILFIVDAKDGITSIDEALAQIVDLGSESQKCKIETPKDLMNNLGLQNMLLISEMVCRSALLRTETRGAHCRSDHPQEDNNNWLKNIVIHKENDKMTLDMHPVQLRYVAPS